MGSEDLPGWDEVLALIRAPKPPVSATVYALGKPTAAVVYDGRGH